MLGIRSCKANKWKTITIEPGFKLHHGARRKEGEVESRRGGWLWGDHWHTINKDYACDYAKSWCYYQKLFGLISVEPIGRLNLIFIGELDLVLMCSMAIKKYTKHLVAEGAQPIRNYLKP